jgi:hypothetical protein
MGFSKFETALGVFNLMPFVFSRTTNGMRCNNSKFVSDIWKFVEQAPSLGIKDLDAPAKRPKVEDATKELKSVATRDEVPRSPGGE